jgi:hypothetical protein
VLTARQPHPIDEDAARAAFTAWVRGVAAGDFRAATAARLRLLGLGVVVDQARGVGMRRRREGGRR